MLKKGHKFGLKRVFFLIVWANLKYFNSNNTKKKKFVSASNFRTYFLPLGEVDASFLNLLSTAINNFIKPKVDFFCK